MWALIKVVLLKLLLRIAAVRLLYKIFGGLLLVPLAFLLKTIGLPVLMILGVLALPVLLVLFVIGLPIFLVVLMGGALLALLSVVLTVGAAAIKFAVLVVLPLWLAWKLAVFVRNRIWRRESPPAADAAI